MNCARSRTFILDKLIAVIGAILLGWSASVAAQWNPYSNWGKTSWQDSYRTESLDALRHLDLSPELHKAIASDILRYPTEQAKKRIAQRLWLDLAGEGVDMFGGEEALAIPIQGATFSDQRAWQQAMRFEASKFALSTNCQILDDRFQTGTVFALANTYYRMPKFGNPSFQQVSPLTPIDGPSSPQLGKGDNPSSLPKLGHGNSPSWPQPQVDISHQNTPATEETLANCQLKSSDLTRLCTGMKDGMRCETFARREFGEVARIVTTENAMCSGTVVGENWVLTAAHCVLPHKSTSTYITRDGGKQTASGDAELKDEALTNFSVSLPYANRIGPEEIARVIVNKEWDPVATIATGPVVSVGGIKVNLKYVHPGDLALVELVNDKAVKDGHIEPAVISSESYDGLVTTAGYGVSTVGGGAPGELFIAWPNSKVSANNDQLDLSFVRKPGEAILPVSTFCQGDSGGPAFEGRHRGCPSNGEAMRPRRLVGVTSYYYPGFVVGGGYSGLARGCESAPIMRFINVASIKNRGWICHTTSKKAKGC